MSDCISPAQHLQGVIPVKNPERVAELLDALKAECEFRFEFDAVAAVSKAVSELPRVTVIDDEQQAFLDEVYTKQKGGHFVRGSGRSLHREVWKYFFGEIPVGFVIHHIDCDKNNNDISNLRLMTKEEHSILHRRGINANKTVQGVCANCGKTFTAYENGRNKFCSKTCACKFHYRENHEIRICAFCGKEFSTSRYGKAKCCSRSCAQKLLTVEQRETRTCPVCHCNFDAAKHSRKRFCSKTCASRAYWQHRRDKIT